jgi:hypothetical protein
VYGAAQDRHKPSFLAELVRVCENETLPLMVGGDFNIIRRQEEKTTTIFMLAGLLFLTPLLKAST